MKRIIILLAAVILGCLAARAEDQEYNTARNRFLMYQTPYEGYLLSIDTQSGRVYAVDCNTIPCVVTEIHDALDKHIQVKTGTFYLTGTNLDGVYVIVSNKLNGKFVSFKWIPEGAKKCETESLSAKPLYIGN